MARSNRLRLHYLQHVPFEGLANIEVWAKDKGHYISGTLLFQDQHLPEMSDFDWLIIMGGPMNVYEIEKYPWLVQESKLIQEAIANGKTVLGVCLGAQLIADALGGKVYKNKHKEIGWFPVSLTEEAKESTLFSSLPDRFTAFHWHGDTFDLPKGATRVAHSEACANQAFVYNRRVVGLQFHLESSTESISALIENGGDELVQGQFIQKREELLPQPKHLQKIKKLLSALLDNLETND